MRVILLQDIEKLGKKYEVKEVKDGYARNFLIPKGLAKPAIKEALKWLEVQKEMEEKKAEKDLKEIQERATGIDGQEIIIPVQVGDAGQLFESIGTQKINEELQKLSIEIKRNQIILEKPIKELGEYPIKIKFAHNLEAEIKVIIVEEK